MRLGILVFLIGVRDKTYLWAQGPAGPWTFWVNILPSQALLFPDKQEEMAALHACLPSLARSISHSWTPGKEQACCLDGAGAVKNTDTKKREKLRPRFVISLGGDQCLSPAFRALS